MSEKSLTVVIPVRGNEPEILNTIYSLPWISQLEVILYSDDKEKTIDLLKKEVNLKHVDDQPTILVSDLAGSANLKKNVAIEDCVSDYITFLSPGTEITKFSYESILQESYDVRFGMTDDVDTLEKSYITQCLPESDEGIIFSVEFLRKNGITPNINSDTNVEFLSKLYDTILEDIIEDYSTGNLRLTFQEGYQILLSSPWQKLNLSSETKTIHDCLSYWSYQKHNSKGVDLRRYIWGKLQRAAAHICSATEGKIKSEYVRFLNPDNMDEILS